MIESVKLICFKQFPVRPRWSYRLLEFMGGNNAGKTTGAAGSLACTAQSASGKLLVTDRKTLQTKVSSTGILYI